MADEEEIKESDKDVETLLNILREKDNLIVSLKESSTKRDKLNEQQIRMLAEDNSRKLMEVKTLNAKLKEMEAKLARSEAELSLFKVTEGKLSAKVEEFKSAFERYRSQVRSSIDQIKFMIQEEITKREEYKNKILDDMKNNYLKMEAQLQELDNYYKEIIADISKKQGLAKRHIRHALNDLQEALSLLDIAHAEFIQPTKIKEDFARLLEESNAVFEEFKEMKGLPSGAMLIKNIENVNVKLESVPQIEGIFEEIHQITETSREHIKTAAKSGLQAGGTGAGAEKRIAGAGGADGRGAGAEKRIAGAGGTGGTGAGAEKRIAGAGGTGGTGAGAEKRIAGAGGAGGRGAGAEKWTAGAGGAGGRGAGAKDSSRQADTTKKAGTEGMGSSSGFISDERSQAEDEREQKKMGEDVQEVIFKRGRNYAPFNWQAILTDIQLKRFQSFIQSCIKAEKEGNYLKALELYKTIREQPGISETIAAKLLDDHIEYLEDLIKRKYAINYE